MSTQTDVRPQPGHSDTDDVLFHYVDKSKIAESAVLGTEVVALCGFRFAVTRDPKPNSPVCGECKAIAEAMRR